MRAYVTAAGMALGLVAGRSWCRSSREILRQWRTGALHGVKGHVAWSVSGSVTRGVSRQ